MQGDDIMSTIKLMILTNLNREYTFYKIINDILILVLMHFIVQNFSCNKIKKIMRYFYINKLFKQKYSVHLEANQCLKATEYVSHNDKLFSDRFVALWHYINSIDYSDKSIQSVKEYADSCNRNFNEDENFNRSRRGKLLKKQTNDIFIINQQSSFNITDELLCNISFSNDYTEDDNKRSKIKIETIQVEIYSYTLNVDKIIAFLDKITDEYNKYIENVRNNKLFIYTYLGNNNTRYNDYDSDRIVSQWEECEFNSSRNFGNLFFEYKLDLISKLDFFKNNKSWYLQEGHPYTLGIGLHGPPGTGKTSIIKCIANRLRRNLVIIPLSKIKTQREFSECYFEKIYNRQNQNSIGFKDKIIVFEDIDCMCDIVKSRDSNDIEIVNNKSNEIANIDKNLDKNTKLLSSIYNKINENDNKSNSDSVIVNIDEKLNNDKITLSYILNVIDGIRETPDRILIITSNYYDKLDKALVRPGRIDITLEMKNASKDIIKSMYNHYYNSMLPDNLYDKIEDYKLSPAKIVNMRLQNTTPEAFCKCLENEFQ